MRTAQDVEKMQDKLKPQLMQLLQMAQKEDVVIKLVVTSEGYELIVEDYINGDEYNAHTFRYLAERKASTTYIMDMHRNEPQIFDMKEPEPFGMDDDCIDDLEFLDV